MMVDLKLQVPVYHPVDDSKFESILKLYDYEKKPLNPEIIFSEENEYWVKEKVAFDSPFGDRIMGYLFLPKNVVKPYQCILWNPHGGVYELGAPADWAAEILYSENIKYGRALFVLIPKGSTERKWEYGEDYPDVSSILFRDRVIRWITENRIGMDYLSSRNDIDMNKVAYITTANNFEGLIDPGVDHRFKCVILIANCLNKYFIESSAAEINPVNFLPRYKAPTYMMNGKYADSDNFYLTVLPTFNLLPEPKRIEAVNSSHVPPLAFRVPLINKWLDESLGPVKFKE
jgi:hypothetical protein